MRVHSVHRRLADNEVGLRLVRATATGLRKGRATWLLVSDSGSQKVQHVFDGFKYNCESSSLTIDGPPENSSDLERAGAARSIDDKFSGGPSIVRKLRRCEVKWFSLSRCTIWDPESRVIGVQGSVVTCNYV